MNKVYLEVIKKRIEELRENIIKEKDNIKAKVLKTYKNKNMFLMLVEIEKKEYFFNGNNIVVLSMYRNKNELINQKIEHIGEIDLKEFESYVNNKKFEIFNYSKRYVFINSNEYNKYK